MDAEDLKLLATLSVPECDWWGSANCGRCDACKEAVRLARQAESDRARQ